MRVRILDSQIDVPLGGADGHGRDGHPFDQGEWVAFHQHPIGERPPSRLRRHCEATNFSSAGVSTTVFHLTPVGNAAPPRPRSPESVTSFTIALGPMASPRWSPGIPVREILVETHRIGESRRVRRSAALASAKYGMAATGPTSRECGPPREEVGLEQRGNLGGRHRPVADTAPPPSRPRRAARANTCHVCRSARCDSCPALVALGRDRPATLFGAEPSAGRRAGSRCSRGPVARPASVPSPFRRDFIETSTVMRPLASTSTSIDGGQPQLPGHDRLEGDRAVGGRPMEVDSEPRLDMQLERPPVHRLAGFGAAQVNRVTAG